MQKKKNVGLPYEVLLCCTTLPIVKSKRLKNLVRYTMTEPLIHAETLAISNSGDSLQGNAIK